MSAGMKARLGGCQHRARGFLFSAVALLLHLFSRSPENDFLLHCHCSCETDLNQLADKALPATASMGAPEEEDVLSLDASSMSGLADDGDDDQTAQEASSSGRFDFTADDADVLVRIVKLAQKHGMAVRHGTWKEYLLVSVHMGHWGHTVMAKSSSGLNTY